MGKEGLLEYTFEGASKGRNYHKPSALPSDRPVPTSRGGVIHQHDVGSTQPGGAARGDVGFIKLSLTQALVVLAQALAQALTVALALALNHTLTLAL